jgi:hypothetical protein
LRLIVRAGDWIDVDEGPVTDLRQISQLGFAGQYGTGLSGYRGLNKLGQLAFNAQFTDGSSGVFIIAVGTAVAGGPPHGSVREALPHTALTLSRARNRWSGYGCRIRGRGRWRRTSCCIRGQVQRER